MPIIFSEEWRKTSTNPFVDALQGMLFGALVAEVLDNREDRQAIRAALESIDERLFQREVKPIIDARKAEIANWPWMWRHYALTEVERLNSMFIHRWLNDDKFRLRTSAIQSRWETLKARSKKVGIVAMTYMPRTICGDIVGTAKSLTLKMDHLEDIIKLREREAEIGAKYGK